jgi:hypothetical protein
MDTGACAEWPLLFALIKFDQIVLSRLLNNAKRRALSPRSVPNPLEPRADIIGVVRRMLNVPVTKPVTRAGALHDRSCCSRS